MNIYGKLQKVSVALQETSLKKSGHNKFAGFKYFELGDFLPTVNKLLLENNLSGYCSFNNEVAMLIISDTESNETIEVTSPMVEISMKGANAIQNLGAVQTYQRRYLYMAALGIVENDIVDSQDMKVEELPKVVYKGKEVDGIDLKTAQKIMKYYKEKGTYSDLLEFYEVKEITSLPMTEGKKLLERIRKGE